jgi:hypothetical protein
MVCLLLFSLSFGQFNAYALIDVSGGTAKGVEVRETFSVLQDKFLLGAHDLHFKLWQQEDNVEVNGWDAIISDFDYAISIRGNQPEPAHSQLKNLGGIPPTNNPDNGQHAVDVDASFSTTVQAVPYNTEVKVVSTFWLTHYNTKHIESTWTRRDDTPQKAVPNNGWEVNWPVENPSNPGQYLHTIKIIIDDLTESVTITGFTYLASTVRYADLSIIAFPAPIPDFDLAPQQSWSLNAPTLGTFVGGHIYFKYGIRWNGVKVFEDIVDHPVTSLVVGGVVFPVDKFGLLAPYIGLASTVLVATVAATLYVKRRKESQ